jgi:hypothetical protein
VKNIEISEDENTRRSSWRISIRDVSKAEQQSISTIMVRNGWSFTGENHNLPCDSNSCPNLSNLSFVKEKILEDELSNKVLEEIRRFLNDH